MATAKAWLLSFSVHFVAGAGAAELFQLYFACGGLLVFGSAVVLSLALGAL